MPFDGFEQQFCLRFDAVLRLQCRLVFAQQQIESQIVIAVVYQIEIHVARFGLPSVGRHKSEINAQSLAFGRFVALVESVWRQHQFRFVFIGGISFIFLIVSILLRLFCRKIVLIGFANHHQIAQMCWNVEIVAIAHERHLFRLKSDHHAFACSVQKAHFIAYFHCHFRQNLASTKLQKIIVEKFVQTKKIVYLCSAKSDCLIV